MKMSEFIAELQKFVNENCPDLMIHICEDKGQADVAVGKLHLGGSFVVSLREFIKNEGAGPKKCLFKAQVLEMLYNIIDLANKDIERIENA